MSTKKINIVILSIYQELGEAFIDTLSPEQLQCMKIGDVEASFNVVSETSSQKSESTNHIPKADAAVVVIRFLDVLSLKKLKNLYQELPAGSGMPVGIVLLRDPGEMDFKISCPACGQKLWLRDTDVGKRGRCPNCKKPFVIMSQTDYVKNMLMLTDAKPVIKVIKGDLESFEKAIKTTLDSTPSGLKSSVADAHAEAMKNVTARIEIPEN